MKNEQILDLVDKLSEKLGTSGEILVETYMPLVIATAWTHIMSGLFLIFISVIGGIGIYYINRKQHEVFPDEGIIMTIIAAVSPILFIAGFAFIFEAIPELIAPEAATISRILTDLKGG